MFIILFSLQVRPFLSISESLDDEDSQPTLPTSYIDLALSLCKFPYTWLFWIFFNVSRFSKIRQTEIDVNSNNAVS